jgi:hypothetical protein
VKKARVLLTNHDGYQAAGLKALATELRAIEEARGQIHPSNGIGFKNFEKLTTKA